jgi:hypothetical protein
MSIHLQAHLQLMKAAPQPDSVPQCVEYEYDSLAFTSSGCCAQTSHLSVEAHSQPFVSVLTIASCADMNLNLHRRHDGWEARGHHLRWARETAPGPKTGEFVCDAFSLRCFCRCCHPSAELLLVWVRRLRRVHQNWSI